VRKIFIDCGTNLGDGLKHFNNRYNFSPEWEFFLFEPNPHLKSFIEENIVAANPQARMTFVNRAVCGTNCPETMTFSMQKTPEHPDAPVGGGSTLLDSKEFKEEELENYETVTVQTVRLSNVINSIMRPHIYEQNGCAVYNKGECMLVVKLDVEGAEYDIIQDLLDTGAAWAISDLHIEFHSRRFKESKIQDEIRLVGELFQRGVNLFSHF